MNTPIHAQTIEQFRDVSSRAACLASLAIAARVIADGDGLADEHQRANVVADITEIIRLLSADMSKAYDMVADEAEKSGAEKNRTAAPVLNHAATFKMPGAWYDLSGRVSAARSVASCAQDALPSGLQGMEYVRMNHAANLIAAAQDILKLMEEDVNLMEEQLGADAQRYARLEKFAALDDALRQAVPN